MAQRDTARLDELLADVSVDDAGLKRLLGALSPSRRGLTDPDELPDVGEGTGRVSSGDLWQLGDHRLLCGDATDPDAVARLLDGAQPRLLATDPPYGVSLDPTWRDTVYNALGRGAKPYMVTDHGDGVPIVNGSSRRPDRVRLRASGPQRRHVRRWTASEAPRQPV
jgi:hypothetical protein